MATAATRRTAAARQRKCRALKKLGRKVLHIEVDKDRIVRALRIARGYSDEQRILRRLIANDARLR